MSNSYIATGWSAHGFALMPAVAEFLAEWMLSSNQPAELAPFGFGRLPAERFRSEACPVVASH
jgi:sarcosine oxidase subunit beta